MKANCIDCQQEYEENDLSNNIFIENGCGMICYKCKLEYYEKSIREDLDTKLVYKTPNIDNMTQVQKDKYELAKKICSEFNSI
jgi:hypothetical protein